MSEMRGGICFILHADLRVGVTLEIVMLGFQALHRNLSHRHPSSLCVPPAVCLFTGFAQNSSGAVAGFIGKQAKGHLFLCLLRFSASQRQKQKKKRGSEGFWVSSATRQQNN